MYIAPRYQNKGEIVFPVCAWKHCVEFLTVNVSPRTCMSVTPNTLGCTAAGPPGAHTLVSGRGRPLVLYGFPEEAQGIVT